MVGLTARFALLAALSSIAALVVLPAPVRGGLVNTDAQDLGPSIAARHSAHGAAIDAAAAANTDGDPRADAKHRRKHHKSSGVGEAAPSHSSGTKDQQSPTSLVPLPAQLLRRPNKEPGKENRNKDEPRTHRPNSKEKHAKEAREVYSIDPVTRMRTLWVAGGITVRDVQLETLPPRLDKRHHHHHHHHHDHGSDKVVVKGDDDNVNIHRRSLSLIAPPGQVGESDLEHEDVFVEGTNDHVHIHDHYLDGNRNAVVVKGNDDHVHVRRAPMPHHYHHHNPDTVVVNGDDQHVHVHREPSPHHHHHHPEKVIVNGDNDHVHLHRSHVSRTHLGSNVVDDIQGHVRVQRSAHHHGEVVVNGGHEEAHYRAPRRRHHRHKTVLKGDHQRVHFGRSPVPSPEPHHHHHRPDKVVVKGNHDHVDVHRKRFQDYRHPIIIGGNRGKAYLIPQKEPVVDSPLSSPAGTKRHVRRDNSFTGVPGVPGTIEIMSQDSGSKATRIASLVVATPGDGSTVAGSPFVLNASDTDRTQMYMVPAISATNGTSASSNSSLPAGSPEAPEAGLLVLSPGSAPPSTDRQASSAFPSTDSAEASFVKVLLQTPIFDAASAQLKPYCATFDPRPMSAAPMTVEQCRDAASSDLHKSQVFAYEPTTGYLHPMWYSGQDDGISGDSDSEPTAPSVPDGAPPAPSSAPAAPASPPAVPSLPVGPADDPPSPPVSSSTSVPEGVPAVTSFEQEALEVEFGDSTHAPVRAPEIFAAEALQNAKNVTLRFSPITPEVLPNSGVGKVAELPTVSAPASPPGANPDSDADTGAAAGSATQSAAASSSDVDSGATTTAAPAASATGTGTGTADASTTDAGSSAVTEQASATPSDSDAGDSLSAQDLLASATPTQVLEVGVYSVDASDTAGASSSSSSGSDSSSAAVVSASTTVSTSGTDSGSSSMPSMTPVSTAPAPYEWMFKGTNASP